MAISRVRLLVIPLCLAVGGLCQAADSVKTVKGVTPVSGKVVAITPTTVNVEQGGAVHEIKEVPVNEIITVFYDSEPAELKTAKTKATSGRPAEALAALERMKADITRADIRLDAEYYKALCTARLAMSGQGDAAEAGRALKAFLDANPQSYHHYEGIEVLGDLLAASGQYPQAIEYYTQIDQAPWPDYKLRAGVAIGRVLLAQKKNDEAMAAFDKVAAAEGTGELFDAQRAAAKLGKASVLLAAGKNDEAVKFLDEFLQKANPDNELGLARAYNLLGTAHRQAGRQKDALLAFLRVEMLYPDVGDARAEALSNLVDLWEQSHKPERAMRAKRTLEDEFPNNRWSKKP